MAGLGTTEILIIAAMAILFFGSARLPRLARSMAEARRELRSAAADDDERDP